MSKVQPRHGLNVVALEYDTIRLWFAAYEVLQLGDVIFEYIGPRQELLKLCGVEPPMFEVGKSGTRHLYDQFGDGWSIERYANDVWRLTARVSPEVKKGPRGHKINTLAERVDVMPLLERFIRGPTGERDGSPK